MLARLTTSFLLLKNWETPCCSQERAAPSTRQTLPDTLRHSHYGWRRPAQAVLDQENPDLFKWLTGQEEAPSDMLANPAFIVRTRPWCRCSFAACAQLRRTIWRDSACQRRVRMCAHAFVRLWRLLHGRHFRREAPCRAHMQGWPSTSQALCMVTVIIQVWRDKHVEAA